MPPPTVTPTRLENVAMCLTMTTNTLQIIADSMKTPFLGAIINTTNAVLKNIQTVNKHKEDCVQLLEQIHKLLDAIMVLHIKAGAELPIEVLDHVGKFTKYFSGPFVTYHTLTKGIRILHKIYTFVEAQQKGNRVKSFFRQSELGILLKDCQAGLQQSFNFFQIGGPRSLLSIMEMQKDAQKKHQEVLDMIEKLSEATGSERASTMSGHYSWGSNSSTSISMLPPEPKIFHGRESELSDILHLFKNGIPRIAIWVQVITIRGAEHPAKVQWTRPFLRALQPLDQEAARLMFADIADSRHNVEEVDQILSLTDNMPLAISLLAHLADTEGCSNVLSHWDKERTSLISEGSDKRSNLDLSISLSLSSPRIQLLPQSQELLSLLSMLPDGLADLDLIQSKLPLENILKCKTALKSTALAYSDEHKKLKVLMPIREYLQQCQPPRDNLVQSLLKYFEEMLKFYTEQGGMQSSSSTILRIKSNLTNIQNVLQWGLKQREPILSNSIYCICYLTHFNGLNIQAQTPLFGEAKHILPQLNDHRLKAYFLIESITLLGHDLIPGSLASQALEHFRYFDDPDLKCRLYNNMAYYHEHFKTDLVEAANMCNKSISLAIPTGNSRRHSQALDHLAWINIQLGKYSAARMYTCEAQKLARVSGDLYTEAQTVSKQAICWIELGRYKQSLALAIMGQSLLALCGMSSSEANLVLMNIQAEVHKRKSEYSEAWKIHTKLAQISADQNSYSHAVVLLNLAEVGTPIGVPQHAVRWNIDHARGIFTSQGIMAMIVSCDCTLADLYLREQDLVRAKTLFEKSLKLAPENSQIKSFCFEQLGNANQWGADYSMFQWTTIFLVYSVKCKQPLQLHKALQFLGDIFLHQQDEGTAISLFTVTLEGFTYMDVHRSRAECMLRLGDISKSHCDMLKAVELWTRARPLFERSSQVKQVQCIDERLACIDSDVLEQHKENIAHLVELNVPSGNTCDIQDEEEVELAKEPHKPVVVKTKNKEVYCMQEDIQDMIDGLDHGTKARMHWFMYKPHASSCKNQENFCPLPSPEKPVNHTLKCCTEDESSLKTEPIDLSLNSDDKFQIMSSPYPKKRSVIPWSGNAINNHNDNDCDLSPPRKKKRSSAASSDGNDDEENPPVEMSFFIEVESLAPPVLSVRKGNTKPLPPKTTVLGPFEIMSSISYYKFLRMIAKACHTQAENLVLTSMEWKSD
ncbi:hypothetical protein B0H14DRAFT_3637440, partial [Mycena olivaceomarginata]